MAESNDIDKKEDLFSVEDAKTAGQPLSDFLLNLEDYTPTVRILYKISFIAFKFFGLFKRSKLN